MRFKKHIIFWLGIFILLSLYLITCSGVDSPEINNNYYTVSFNSHGGDGVSSQRVVSGETATEPEPEGITHGCYGDFQGWYADEQYTNLYVFTNVVTNDLTLHAKWDQSTVEEMPVANNQGKYEIACWQHLQWISGGETNAEERGKRLGYDYILLGDITFPEPGEEGFPEYGFIPIGYDTEGNNERFDGMAFTGSFDGGDHIINNFFINAMHSDWTVSGGIYSGQRLDDEFIGLFGKIAGTGTVVKDLTVVLRPITDAVDAGVRSSGNYIGGMVAFLESGTLSNVGVKGSKVRREGNGFYTGGLVGYNNANGEVIGYATTDVSGDQNIGGLVGQNHGTVTGYATGNVGFGQSGVGGLVGWNFGTIIGYATGDVRGGVYVAGLVGWNNNINSMVIGYSTGHITLRSDSGASVCSSFVAHNSGNVIGYSTSKLDCTPGTSATSQLDVLAFEKHGQQVIGYWDVSSVGYAISGYGAWFGDGSGDGGGKGISATRNIVFTGSGYKDNATGESIFNESEFKMHFDTDNGKSKTWPKLRNFPFEQPRLDDSTVEYDPPIFTVNFQHHKINIPDQNVAALERVTSPNEDAPNLFPGYSCTGPPQWYRNGGVDKFDFSTPIVSNMLLYADFAPNENNGKLEICHWRQLAWIRKHPERLDDDYVLVNDIVFPEPGEDGFPDWGFKPIGYDSSELRDSYGGTPFTGTLDGGGFTISNLYINAWHGNWQEERLFSGGRPTDQWHIGLFGQIDHEDAVVKDLTIVLHPINTTIPTAITTPGGKVGGLAGELKRGMVSNVAVIGGRIQGNRIVGGLVGDNSGADNIIFGYADVEILGGTDKGGLVGDNIGKVIGYATGKITGTDTDLTIAIGGLVADNRGTLIGYAVSEMTGTGVNIGGMVGTNSGEVIGYWDEEFSGISNAGMGTESSTVTGISATRNIEYNGGTYTDTAKTNTIFNEAAFTELFDITAGMSKVWPKLKNTLFSSSRQITISDNDGDGEIEVMAP